LEQVYIPIKDNRINGEPCLAQHGVFPKALLVHQPSTCRRESYSQRDCNRSICLHHNALPHLIEVVDLWFLVKEDALLVVFNVIWSDIIAERGGSALTGVGLDDQEIHRERSARDGSKIYHY